jgi:hypothetical protein
VRVSACVPRAAPAGTAPVLNATLKNVIIQSIFNFFKNFKNVIIHAVQFLKTFLTNCSGQLNCPRSNMIVEERKLARCRRHFVGLLAVPILSSSWIV